MSVFFEVGYLFKCCFERTYYCLVVVVDDFFLRFNNGGGVIVRIRVYEFSLLKNHNVVM